MIFLVPKFLLLFGFPIAIAILWQRRVRVHWNILLFALGAFAVNYLWQRLLGPQIPQFVWEVIPPFALPVWMSFYSSWVAVYLIYGLFREGIRWLVLRYAATNVRSWQDGIMFGIAYGSIVMLLRIGNDFFGNLEDMGLFTSTLEFVVVDRSGLSFDEIVVTLNRNYPWWKILFMTWTWGVFWIIFQVGTCLAVVFSVQRRAVLPFLAAVVLYVVYATARTTVTHSSFLNSLFGWLPSNLHLPFFIEIELLNIIFALLCLLLIFLLRKPMATMAVKETP